MRRISFSGTPHNVAGLDTLKLPVKTGLTLICLPCMFQALVTNSLIFVAQSLPFRNAP